MSRRSQSSSRWRQEHFNDPCVRRIQADMAPTLNSMDVTDQSRAMRQAGLALDMVGRVLKPGGAALIKVFQGAGFQELVAASRRPFKSVRFIKPAASRARSAETCLVASGLRLV